MNKMSVNNNIDKIFSQLSIKENEDLLSKLDEVSKND